MFGVTAFLYLRTKFFFHSAEDISYAAEKKLSVEFAISCEPTVADPKKLGNRITAVFRDLGDPAGPVPVRRLWRRRRKADLGWVTGQLVFDGDEMFILTREC